MDALVIFAKFPEAGKVKKQIGKALGMDTSAGLCNAFIEDTISKNVDKDYDLYLSFIGREYKQQYRDMFKSVIQYVQRGTNLGENMRYAFEDLLDNYDKVIVISCDVPNLGTHIIRKAFNALDQYDAVVGPAEDGGYYLLGLKSPQDIFEGLPWGKENLLEEQLKHLEEKKLGFVLLDILPDVDNMDELTALKKILKKDDAPRTYDFLQQIEL